MTSVRRMVVHEAADTLHKFVYSGILGSTEGMGVSYALLDTFRREVHVLCGPIPHT
jgi:hypothetical protein